MASVLLVCPTITAPLRRQTKLKGAAPAGAVEKATGDPAHAVTEESGVATVAAFTVSIALLVTELHGPTASMV
jgi:hypothetical protein